MKKACLIVSFFIALSIYTANALLIEVGISEKLDGEIVHFTYNTSTNLVKFSSEFRNTGSVGYKARMRIDIFGNSSIFTSWSDEKALLPGARKNYESYWYINTSGNFTARLRMYFGNEIYEKEFSFGINQSVVPEDIFEISGFRTYENRVAFRVNAGKPLEGAVAIPYNYPKAWVFEQSKVPGSGDVTLFYEPALWRPSDVTIGIVSDDGRYFTSRTFRMDKKIDILFITFYIMDSIKPLLAKTI